VAGRGGLTKPIPAAYTEWNAKLIRDVRSAKWGEHASNLGAPVAHEIAKRCGAPAFIADPVTSDEFWPLARYAGHPAFERKSRLHALSQRAAARRAADELDVSYHKVNFVVVHMAGQFRSAPTARAAWSTRTTPWTATVPSRPSGAARCRPANW